MIQRTKQVQKQKTRQTDRVELDLYINKIIGDEPHMVRVRDISGTGVYLYKLLEPSMLEAPRVGLELKLPNSDEVIWAVGEIVRQESRAEAEGMAIRFVRIAEHDRRVIETYVEDRHKQTTASQLRRVAVA